MSFPRRSTFALSLALATSPATAATPSMEEMWQRLQQQEAEIAALRDRLATAEANAAAAKNATAVAEERLDATADLVESRLDIAATESATTVGGYGEMHYNDLDADDSDNDLNELDFHRFVAFLAHDFNDRIRFFSEVEIEHSLVEDTGDGSGPGELELEQAYVEFDLDDRHIARTGLFLVPVGITNETHEPPTFYGVERNDVEAIIVPATWWEGGASIGGRYGSGFSWDIAVHSGLETPVTGSNAFRIRSGRQKVAEAAAEDLAYTARIRYTGIPGLELAGALQWQSDMTQRSDDGLDDGLLTEVHGVWSTGPVTLKALWARWDLDGDLVEAADADVQEGWYVEPSYRFDLAGLDLGIYGRWEDVDAARLVDRFEQWEVGMNYWPHERVVLKFDYRDRSHDEPSERDRDFDGIDLGVGYQF
jgi:hypothetical protein